jgi:hypothetical protein
VPVTTTKPVLRLAPKTKRELWELQEVLVELFTAAAVEDLTPTPEAAATAGYQADHG